MTNHYFIIVSHTEELNDSQRSLDTIAKNLDKTRQLLDDGKTVKYVLMQIVMVFKFDKKNHGKVGKSPKRQN